MTIYPVTASEFAPYGRVVTGYETECAALVAALNAHTPLPEATDYVPEEKALQSLPEASALGVSLYGGMPVQFGWCNGHNTKLNCLEYHRDSELNVGVQDFILLLAKREEMADGRLDTGKVEAFLCPAGTLVEVYATTLHYAPCSAKAGEGFQVAIVLPKGTNLDKPAILAGNQEDQCLWARNKWLLAHKDSSEAAQGAPVRLDGENIDIAGLI